MHQKVYICYIVERSKVIRTGEIDPSTTYDGLKYKYKYIIKSIK